MFGIYDKSHYNMNTWQQQVSPPNLCQTLNVIMINDLFSFFQELKWVRDLETLSEEFDNIAACSLRDNCLKQDKTLLLRPKAKPNCAIYISLHLKCGLKKVQGF